MKSLFEELANACRGDVLKDEPMERHTTFRVGGPADMMVVPEDRNDLKKCLRILEARKVRPVLIGKGSNLIVSDSGIRGVVIKIAWNMAAIKINKYVVMA